MQGSTAGEVWGRGMSFSLPLVEQQGTKYCPYLMLHVVHCDRALTAPLAQAGAEPNRRGPALLLWRASPT